jgi:hypothetical protein
VNDIYVIDNFDTLVFCDVFKRHEVR